ncbi:MAG: glycosyltransferase [Geminicoccaceae bacterium]|nr:glycosyltransferase [Geminicoccaceae bacterium]
MAVIIPVRNQPVELEACLAGVLRAGVRPEQIVVVDDASAGAATAQVAERHGVRLVRRDRRGGPAAARNAGVAAAAGARILFFVDSDVVVAPDVLRRLELALREPTIGAVFGSYDAVPAVRTLVSRYRNLLHHYVHQEGAAEAWTFWSGCGAIRREAFLAVGGFDESWAWVEDIELGYRLRSAGWRIRLEKTLQGTHLKRWTLVSMIRSDVAHRARPWTRLLLEAGVLPDDLNVSRGQRASVALSCIAVAGLPLAPVLPQVALPVIVAALIGVTLFNARLLGFLSQIGGPGFAAMCFPLHVIHHVCAGLGFAWGWTEWRLGGARLSRVLPALVPRAGATPGLEDGAYTTGRPNDAHNGGLHR